MTIGDLKKEIAGLKDNTEVVFSYNGMPDHNVLVDMFTTSVQYGEDVSTKADLFCINYTFGDDNV